MRFFNRLKQELFYGGLTKEEFHLIKEPVDKYNHKNLLIWLGAISVFWVSNLLIYNKPPENACQPVMVVALVINAFILLYALFL